MICLGPFKQRIRLAGTFYPRMRCRFPFFCTQIQTVERDELNPSAFCLLVRRFPALFRWKNAGAICEVSLGSPLRPTLDY